MVEVRHIHSAPVFPADPAKPPVKPAPAKNADAFERVFRAQLQQAQPLKFSRHASERLQERGIAFDAQQLEKINETVSRVAEKGGRESVLFADGVALVVNVPQRTVITCVAGNSAGERIFTNIDSCLRRPGPAD